MLSKIKIGDSVVCSAPMCFPSGKHFDRTNDNGIVLEPVEFDWYAEASTKVTEYPVTFCRMCGSAIGHRQHTARACFKDPARNNMQGPFWKVMFPTEGDRVFIGICAEEWLEHKPTDP